MSATVPFLLVPLEEAQMVGSMIFAHMHAVGIARSRSTPAAPYQFLS